MIIFLKKRKFEYTSSTSYDQELMEERNDIDLDVVKGKKNVIFIWSKVSKTLKKQYSHLRFEKKSVKNELIPSLKSMCTLHRPTHRRIFMWLDLDPTCGVAVSKGRGNIGYKVLSLASAKGVTALGRK